MADRAGVLTGSRVRLGLASDEWLVGCVRRGDTAAFEALYDRHVRELLGFCVYMLGSRQDGEDAVQATFASAYRALRADGRAISLRPWLFTIARNECLTILRRRRPVVELGGEIASGHDPVDEIELRDEVRRVFEGLRELPESQRAALVLAEVHGLSYNEVGEAMGVRPDQVKAFVYQARSKLVSERAARDADCREIREELAGARGAALLRGRLRRHVRSCPECRSYADGMARQRRQLGGLLPIVPSLALKARAIEAALNVGSSDPVAVAGGATVGATAAGTAAELASGGINALVCKVAVGVACLGAGAGVGVSVLSSPLPAGSSAQSTADSGGALLASLAPNDSRSAAANAPAFSQSTLGSGGTTDGGTLGARDGQAAPPAIENGVVIHEGPSVGPAPGESSRGPEASPRSESGSGGRSTGGGERSVALERRVQAEQRRIQHEGHRQRHEERKQAREEPRPPPAPKSEEELLRQREEHARSREEHKPEGHSRAPRTPEELRLKREKHEAEKRKLREQQEATQREAEEAAAEEAASEEAPRAP